jgi:hypothetical protein
VVVLVGLRSPPTAIWPTGGRRTWLPEAWARLDLSPTLAELIVVMDHHAQGEEDPERVRLPAHGAAVRHEDRDLAYRRRQRRLILRELAPVSRRLRPAADDDAGDRPRPARDDHRPNRGGRCRSQLASCSQLAACLTGWLRSGRVAVSGTHGRAVGSMAARRGVTPRDCRVRRPASLKIRHRAVVRGKSDGRCSGSLARKPNCSAAEATWSAAS